MDATKRMFERAGGKKMRLRSVIPALIVLALLLLTSVLAALSVQRDVEALERRQFVAEGAAVKDAIGDAMRTYQFALHAGAGLFESGRDVGAREWRAFVRALRLEKDYPGFQGFGFAEALHRDELGTVEQRERAKGNETFSIHPKDDRDFYTAIMMLAPDDWRNQRAIGYDMFSEPVRRAAMERARDSGDAALSGRVILMQETATNVQPGTLLYVPIYAPADEPPKTAEERRTRLRGFMYGAFRMGDLISAVLNMQTPDAARAFLVEVYDGSTPGRQSLLYSNADLSGAAPGRRLQAEFPIDVAGRRWTMSVSADEPILQNFDKSKPWLVLTGGIVIAALIAAITAFQALAREDIARSRQALAVEVGERKKAQEAAELANNELIHRVKNTLAVVSAIASQTARYSTSIEDFARAFRDRLASLARVQDLLRPNSAVEPDLEGLVRQVLDPYIQGGAQNLAIKGERVRIARNDIVLFSLTLNELATNATKYGAWSVAKGNVAVSWLVDSQEDGEVLVLKWRESGGPAVSVPDKKGFGTAVLQFAVERGMRGKIDVNYEPEGIVYVIRLPRKMSSEVELG